ncbi:MAG: carbohydrate ABC transporter permease [Erysipelotrichaceae bacterium]
MKQFIRKNRESLTFWMFLSPALIAFTMVIVIPFLMGIYYSFTDWTGAAQKTITFIGWENYKIALSDVRFLYSTIITVIYTTFNIILVNVVSFSLALLVTSKLKLTNLYRAGFFLPNLIGGIILGYIWQFVFSYAVPEIFSVLGSTYFVENLPILAKASTSLVALVVVSTWQYAGYIMMIYVAALQNVPKDLLEAAKVDGANWWQRFRNITLPMVAPAFTVTLFLTLVNSFKQFDVNVSLTGSGPAVLFMGKPIPGMELLAQNIANTGTIMRNNALAQSKAVIFFVVLVFFSLIQVYFSKKREVEM